MFRVIVKPEIARLRDNDTGTRNVRVGGKDGKVHTFSRRPTYFAEVPDEVKADPMLVIDEVDKAPPAEPAKAEAPKKAPKAATTTSGAELHDDGALDEDGEEPPEPKPAPKKRGRKAKGA